MKKTDVNLVDLYCVALKGVTLATNMLVLTAICNSDDKECEEFIKLNETYQQFDKAMCKTIKAQKLSLHATIANAKKYYSALSEFKKIPDVQTDDMQELIESQEEIIQSIINLEH